jgi:hypothetical protein
MKFSKSLILAVSIGIVFATFNVQAESLRCGGELALIGYLKAAILGKCGEPMLKDSFCKPGTANVRSCEMVDQWTYNPGSGQFYTALEFERGILKSMKFGARVP